MNNNERPAETEAQQGDAAEVTTSTPTCSNTIVSGSCNHGFLKDAVDELETFRTPKKIVDYIEAERLKVIIGNPPYDVSNCH